MTATVGFIGTGNMGAALARAVCKTVPPQQVLLANRTPPRRKPWPKSWAAPQVPMKRLPAPAG